MASAIRMTAASSNLTTTLEQNSTSDYPTIGGQYFSNADCSSIGPLNYETNIVPDGQATFTVAASNALLIYL
jgi:hypothetical protein